MRTRVVSLLLSAAVFGLPVLAGCERELAHERRVTETPTGKTKVEEKTVTEKSDGTIEKKTEKKTVPNP